MSTLVMNESAFPISERTIAALIDDGQAGGGMQTQRERPPRAAGGLERRAGRAAESLGHRIVILVKKQRGRTTGSSGPAIVWRKDQRPSHAERVAVSSSAVRAM